MAKITGYHNRRKDDFQSNNVLITDMIAAIYNTMRQKKSDKVYTGRDLYPHVFDVNARFEPTKEEKTIIMQLESLVKQGLIPEARLIKAKQSLQDKYGG